MKKIINCFLVSLTTLLSGFSIQSFSQTSFYVDSAQVDSIETGMSRTYAYNNLDSAIIHAQANDTIKVASGTYFPSSKRNCTTCLTNDRYNYYLIDTAIILLGSFDPISGDQDYSQQSILSGDIGVQGDSTDNILQVLIILHAGDVNIDGFIFEHGNATPPAATSTLIDGLLVQHERGAGAYISVTTTSTRFNHCAFRGNYAGSGGAIFAFSQVQITNSSFNSNSAGVFGGAILLRDSPNNFEEVLSENNITIASNSEGGAVNVHINANSDFVACNFQDNSANGNGGAIFSKGNIRMYFCELRNNTCGIDGGGIYVDDLDSLILKYCSFLHNHANDDAGGLAIYNNGHGYYSHIHVDSNSADDECGGLRESGNINTIIDSSSFLSNSCLTHGGGLLLQNATVAMAHCNIANNSDRSDYSDEPRTKI